LCKGFSELSGSIVKRQPFKRFKPFNRYAPFRYERVKSLRVQGSRYPAAVQSILDFRFWILASGQISAQI